MPNAFEEIYIRKNFSGGAYVSFPKAPHTRTIVRDRVAAVLTAADTEINATTPIQLEKDAAARMKAAVSSASARLSGAETVSAAELATVRGLLPAIEGAAKTSSIGPRYAQLQADLEGLNDELAAALPKDVKEARNLAYQRMPSFVYYTNYGNLDSEIYLPHVIDNMERDDLGAKEQAKVRTLKVLFEFVGLKPEEILELGLDFKAPLGKDREPTDDESGDCREKEGT